MPSRPPRFRRAARSRRHPTRWRPTDRRQQPCGAGTVIGVFARPRSSRSAALHAVTGWATMTPSLLRRWLAFPPSQWGQISRRSHRDRTSASPRGWRFAQRQQTAGARSVGLEVVVSNALTTAPPGGGGVDAGTRVAQGQRRAPMCRPLGRWSPHRCPPNRTCEFPRIRLSTSTWSGFGSCHRLLDALDRQLLVAAGAQDA